MPINIEWKSQKRIAYVVSSGIPDTIEMQNAADTLLQVMRGTTAAVHLIWDVRSLDQFPSLIDCIRSPYVKHPRHGIVIVVGLSDKPLFRILVNSLSRVIHLSIKTAESLEDGLALLHNLDSSLLEET